MLKNRFKNVPVENDTQIIKTELITIKNLECKYEYWEWDGVYAESLIFVKDDVKHLNEDEFKALSSSLLKTDLSEVTMRESGEYVFLNFNFEAS